MLRRALLFLIFSVLCAKNAYAYLDPGTGNAVVYVVLSLIGALGYSLKNIFYKLISKREAKSINHDNYKKLVIFSEGKNYYNTFEPLVQLLIKKQQPFVYYTMDIDDPLLLIENDYMNSKYIGSGSLGMFKLNHLSADIVVATTPNIGTLGYPVMRSPKIKKLVHVFHSFGHYAYAWYHKGSLDAYDVVFTTGDYMEPQIRHIEKLRSLQSKEIVVAGVPYLDKMAEKIAINKKSSSKSKTLLIAPSWGSKSLLNVYGSDFIAILAEAGFDIIIRPHPQSYKVENEKLEEFKQKLSAYGNVVWDKEVDGSISMLKSDMLISDTSSIRLDYMVLYHKPVITMAMPDVDHKEYEYGDLEDILSSLTMEEDIGSKVSSSDVKDIVSIVQNLLLQSTHRDYDALTKKYISNFRHSADKITDYLISELNKKEN